MLSNDCYGKKIKPSDFKKKNVEFFIKIKRPYQLFSLRVVPENDRKNCQYKNHYSYPSNSTPERDAENEADGGGNDPSEKQKSKSILNVAQKITNAFSLSLEY